MADTKEAKVRVDDVSQGHRLGGTLSVCTEIEKFDAITVTASARFHSFGELPLVPFEFGIEEELLL